MRERSGRKREQRARSVPVRELLRLVKKECPAPTVRRPATRAHCATASRPCPFVGCRHHLYLDTRVSGSITYNFPDLDVDELEETCALDVADRGGATLEEVGPLMNITRERVRQIQVEACRKIGRDRHLEELAKEK